MGESPDRLTLAERREYAGHWIALEIYTPETLPLRRIEAMGASAAECVAALRARALDPSKFEYDPITPAY